MTDRIDKDSKRLERAFRLLFTVSESKRPVSLASLTVDD